MGFFDKLKKKKTKVDGATGVNSSNVSETLRENTNEIVPIFDPSEKVDSTKAQAINEMTLEEQISYEAIPILEQTKLPRGGVSVHTEAVGRVQFGIPPETIKDSMNLGLDVPVVYIVPIDRFCREMGPALGVNLAEFEFPAYFNFFVNKRKCTLIVDSMNAEQSIRTVFGETLLGPTQFRDPEHSIPYEEEDFATDYPRNQIPDFAKELQHFRIMPDGKELVIETLLNFVHFERVKNPEEKTFGKIPSLDDSALSADVKNLDEEGFTNENDYEINEEENFQFDVVRFTGKVATVYPPNATEDEINENPLMKRIEIFIIFGGVGYVIHDINDRNEVIARTRISSRVYVPDSMIVDGYGNLINDDFDDVQDNDEDHTLSIISEPEELGSNGNRLSQKAIGNIPPSFYPPSFGVTVLGNSHGFDKSGSTSGYVLWVNGRGIMIDPPPYSTATLERDGIRAGTIVGIILTHCHADHDAGAFQKVLSDRPVVVITTPTIYKSFIRKYAALSGLSQEVLMHSHRHRPAIIGKPLKFQGATFYFQYSLHTIPCVGFRVEWRRRSMVFTGDHFNSPDGIAKLLDKGVLSKGRADDLLEMPLQDTDLLLHEAGAPPIHTPLSVLQALPPHIQKHLYVVHTSALPEDCKLRIAPTGTSGTIRLDEYMEGIGDLSSNDNNRLKGLVGISEDEEDDDDDPMVSYRNRGQIDFNSSMMFNNGNNSHKVKMNHSRDSLMLYDDDDLAEKRCNTKAPTSLVMLRPTSSSDAWFILNLMSSVPFFTSLSYTHAMEVLETARVDAFCMNDVVVSSNKRRDVLCVFWEGVCMEKDRKGQEVKSSTGNQPRPSVWFAGDWTGPRALQPDLRLSGDSSVSDSRDIVAISSTGVKVITIEFSVLHEILLNGSELYAKYNDRLREQAARDITNVQKLSEPKEKVSVMERAVLNFNLVDVLQQNSTFNKLRAVQKRHMESIVDGPFTFEPFEEMWTAGNRIDKVYLIVYGTAKFVSSTNPRNSAEMNLARKTMVAKIKSESVADLSKINDSNGYVSPASEQMPIARRKSTKQRLTNKIFSRLYIREELFDDFLFSRGNFLGDVSRIVGDLANAASLIRSTRRLDNMNNSAHGKKQADERYRSTLVAGPDGCVAVSISKANLRKYLDNNPGLLLCLLGTEVVV